MRVDRQVIQNKEKLLVDIIRMDKEGEMAEMLSTEELKAMYIMKFGLD